MKRHHQDAMKVIVVRRNKKKKKTKTKLATATATAGIPCFATRQQNSGDSHVEPLEDEFDDNDDDNEIFISSLANTSDAYLALTSLQQESRGLHVPLLGGKGGGPQQEQPHVQLVLEFQILQRLSSSSRNNNNNPSDTWKELRDMVRQNTLCSFSILSPHRVTAYMETTLYVQGVRNAHQYHSHSNLLLTWVVDWFLEHLQKNWTTQTARLQQSEMKHEWVGNTTSSSNSTTTSTSFEEAIRYLVTIQVLRRETTMTTGAGNGDDDDDSYSLWLPNLGRLLKTWSEARQQVVGLLQRAPGRELSQSNLLAKNRHAKISTAFLLQDLQVQGLVRYVERPFGTFVQLLQV